MAEHCEGGTDWAPCDERHNLRLVQQRFGWGNRKTKWLMPKLLCPKHRESIQFRYADKATTTRDT
jgi:hypothetical protein